MADRFARFLGLLPLTEHGGGPPPLAGGEAAAFTDRFAGATFAHGVYRVHDSTSADEADAWVRDGFPTFPAGSIRCFAYDWQGRQFGLQRAGGEPGAGPVLLLDIDLDLVLKIPYGVDELHERELPDNIEQLLDLPVLRQLCAARPDTLPLPRDSCAGYSVPPFMGGEETISNIKVVSIDVQWTINTQMLRATEGLPEGTPITGFTIS